MDIHRLHPDAAESERSLLELAALIRPPEIDGELSRRELDVLRCFSHGLGLSGTADILYISPLTVKDHLKNASRKVGAKNRCHLVGIALRRGWID